ncbi:fructosamine kinase family protein [Inmirania thermothiophila]|uniref:Fructosamine-3-kinase n=1 Tax=Inmirania thermothiophila TaxID=1750597 RepID=A0A3N1Y6C2_9GAMM|nr:fructosamine kinase family protein [Inmirania thermothiophila]ROR34300.1 fructosamine-3-kinase [Inmirania thermothiophila]
MSGGFWGGVEAAIAAAAGRPFRIGRRREVGGGCIHRAAVVEGEGGRWFVKRNRAAALPQFEAEADGLAALAAAGALRVPRPLTWGEACGEAYLVMEYLPLGRAGPQAEEALGRGLAALHRCAGEAFGWHRDNFIGATPQPNPRERRWAVFFREQRIAHQLRLARERGAPGGLLRRGEALLAAIPALLAGHDPVPSLIHGDLWGGNWAADEDGRPVIFDPAVYHGDREADLAMTELFGGFGPRFHAAYREAWPLDAGYGVRRTLYNLYHVLNHFNLFGGGYAAQAEAMMERLLAEVRG